VGLLETRAKGFQTLFGNGEWRRRVLYTGYAEGQRSSSEALEEYGHRRHGSYSLGGKVEGKTLKVALKCRETRLFLGDKRQRSLKLKTLGS
jgi:hypothetical protein